MELVVVAVFAFAGLALFAAYSWFALRVLAIALGDAHRKLMARDLQDLANAAAAEKWAEEPKAEHRAPSPPEAAAFDPVNSWYGSDWRFPS